MNSLAYGALWVFVFVLPWERILVLPGLAVVSKVTGGLALALAVLAVVMSGRFRRWHPFHVLALLFVIWAGWVLTVVDVPEIPAKFWTFVQLLAVIWMIWEVARTRSHYLGLILAYVCGAHVAAFNTILLYWSKGAELRRFAVGGADPNDSAMLLALALPMAWFLGMIYRRPFLQWTCRAYLPLGLVALGLTGSRGGMIASVVGLLMIPVTMTKLSPGRRLTAVVLLSISVVVAAMNTPATLVERLASTRTEVEEADIGGRFRIWVGGIHAFTEKPLIGYGTSRFKAAVAPWGIGLVAHNSFLSVLVEQGLIGLMLYVSMIGAVVLTVRRLPPLERRFGLILLGTLGVAMLPLTWEDQRAVWVILAVLVGYARAVPGPRVTLRQAVSRVVPDGPTRLQARPARLVVPGESRLGDGTT